MSKLSKRLEEIRKEQEVLLAENYTGIGSTLEDLKARGKAIKTELKSTKYPPRVKELEAKRDALLAEAKAFYASKYGTQKAITDSFSPKYDELITFTNEDIATVDLLNMDLSSHKLQLVKDIVMSKSAGELSSMMEDLVMDPANKEVVALIRMYGNLRAQKEMTNHQPLEVLSSGAFNYPGDRGDYFAFKDIANVDRIKETVQKNKVSSRYLYTSAYQTETQDSFVGKVYDNSPYADLWG